MLGNDTSKLQSGVAIILLALVGLMLLVPPLAFQRAVSKFVRNQRASLGLLTRAVITFGAFLPFLLNLGYMSYAWSELSSGSLNPDRAMAVAVLISWFCFWGRVILTRRTMRAHPFYE